MTVATLDTPRETPQLPVRRGSRVLYATRDGAGGPAYLNLLPPGGSPAQAPLGRGAPVTESPSEEPRSSVL